MKRFIMVLAVMGLMAAMVAASAMPAFADAGGQRGHATFTGNLDTCTPGTGECLGTFTFSGGSRGGGGHATGEVNNDIADGSIQGGSGGPGGGSGGNCTITSNTSDGGHGNRC